MIPPDGPLNPITPIIRNMKLQSLREQVWRANMQLPQDGLVFRTWGNVSGLDKASGVFAIKPSGVPYGELSAENMVLVDLDGHVVEGDLNPSSDLATHLALYRAWPEIGGVAHTHSLAATSFAQARRAIPCYGTTHADYFHGTVPCTRPLTEREINDAYEAHTGDVIIETFADKQLNPLHIPAVLVCNHGPFTWGADAMAAADNAAAYLEMVAKLALDTLALSPECPPADRFLLDKHFLRKHGPNAYYGQGKH